MKRILLLLALLGVLTLISCAPTKVCEAPYTQIGDNCCMDLNENQICDDDEAPFVPGEEEVVELSMGSLMQTYADNVQAYSYVLDENKYYVAGDNVKRVLARQEKVAVDQPIGEKKLRMVWVDVIYFARGEEPTATAYCEGTDENSERLCSGFGLWDLPIKVNYEKYYTQTPDEWLINFAGKTPDSVEEQHRFVIPSIEVARFIFMEEGMTTTIDVDTLTGVVWYVETIDTDGFKVVYDYKDQMKVNSIPEIEYVHQVREVPEKPDFSPED